ncbi:potassium channel family protein [Cerasicoccus fimbriatus]|uniref:potassium channel family protein n=1 Tax=Cerasicoccus fimbriatus TaxID=3014554 RepID=UPI0022B2AF9A|nr:potassium channel family protein [Cerasicoccus sp. TK19100]
MNQAEHQAIHRMQLEKYFWLLAALVVLLVLVPVFDNDTWGAPVLGIISMLTLVLALRTIAHELRTLIIGLVLGVAGYGASTYAYIMDTSPLLALPFQLAFYGFVNLSLLREILTAHKINADTICGGICVYLLLGLNFAIIFSAIEFIQPGSLMVSNSFDQDGVKTPMDFVYFSFVTLTTLGYGDIVPVSNAARSAAIATSVSGVLFIAVFIGRLVGLTTAQGMPYLDTEE